MDLQMLILGTVFLFAVSFISGFYLNHRWQRNLDLASLKKARTDLSKINRKKDFDFFPGTFQYRPIISAYTNNAVDKIFIWHTDSDFGIGGAYTRDGKFTIDEFPLVINYSSVEPESFIALGHAISKFGENLKAKNDISA